MKSSLLLLIGLFKITLALLQTIPFHVLKNSFVNQDYHQLITKLDENINYFKINNDWENYVYTNLDKAYCHLLINQPKAAETIYTKMHQMANNLGNKPLTALIEAKWCYYYAKFGNKPSCIKYKNKLLRKIDKESFSPTINKDIYKYIGFAYFMYSNHLDSAIYYTKKAAQISIPNENRSFEDYEYPIHYILGFYNFILGKKNEGLKQCKRGLKESIKVNSNQGITKRYQLLATIYRDNHNYEKALKYLLLLDSKRISDRKTFINNLALIGGVYQRMGNYNAGKPYLYKSLKLFDATFATDNISSVYTFKLRQLDLLGNIYLAQDNFDSAQYFYKEAYHIRQKLFGKHNPKLIYSYKDLANLYKERNLSKSKDYLSLALHTAHQAYGNTHKDVSDINWLLADYYRVTNTFKALTFAQKAIKSAVYKFNDSSICINPSLNNINAPPQLLKALSTKGDLFTRYYQEQTQNPKDLQFALETYQLALDLGDTIRLSFRSEGSQLELAKTTSHIYQGAIQNAYELYELTQNIAYLHTAFELQERNKAAVLLSKLQAEKAKSAAQLPQKLIEQEQDLKAELNYYTSQIERLNQKDNHSEEEQKALKRFKNREFDLREQLDAFMVALEKDYPKYYQLKYNLHTASVREVQALLKEDQNFISYFRGKQDWYIFLITQKEFNVVKTPIQKEEGLLVEQFRSSLMNGADVLLTNDSKSAYCEQAHALYRAWVKPIDKLVRPGSEFIIVPYGQMALVPFEALLEKMPVDNAPINFKKLDYLIRTHPTSYANSATLWCQAKQEKTSHSSNNILAFAPSFESTAANFTNTEYQDTVRGALGPLSWTKKELGYIANYFKGRFYLDEQADEQQFKQLADHADIIHIASHAVAQDERPLFSRIYFTENKDSLEDDALHTFELYNLNLQAKLAVLSACNTGYGKAIHGEGVINLARGFFYAGCPSVVMSLWNANDHTTAEIMRIFYKELDNGKSKVSALQQAKLEYIDGAKSSKAHPYYWAQFIAAGDMRPIVSTNLLRNFWLLVISIMILGAFVYLRSNR